MKKELTALDVANFFLVAQDPDEAGEGISNMKMQKLCYYAQGLYLAKEEKRLFDNDLEAWLHGPVVPELYERYREYGYNPLPLPKNFSLKSIPKKIQGFLDDIYRLYGQYSAWRLRNMTHMEAPWLNAREAWLSAREREKKAVISDHDLIHFFKAKLVYLDS